MINISLFNRPEGHPFGMLEGYKHASEKESVLTWMLQQCIDSEKWVPVATAHAHPTMVNDGLLVLAGDRVYTLTEKAKGLLYAHFHKCR